MSLRTSHLALLAAGLLLSCGRPTDLPDARQPSDIADLYVAPAERGGDDTSSGDRSTAPLATLGAALQKAAALGTGGPVTVAVVQGSYPETVTVGAGLDVSLAGGYDNTDPYLWTRPGDAATTTVQGQQGAAAVVRGGALAIDGLTLVGGPGTVEGVGYDDPASKATLGGGGALVLVGGTAAITRCSLNGGAGQRGEIRTGVFATQDAQVTVQETTIHGGEGASVQIGLVCAVGASCEISRSPLLTGGDALRESIVTDLGPSIGIAGLGAESMSILDNQEIRAGVGYLSMGIYAEDVALLDIAGNDLIRSEDGVEYSHGVEILGCASVSLTGNGTVSGARADESVGIFIEQSTGAVQHNRFILGGDAMMISVGIDAEASEVDITDNGSISGGSAHRTLGALIEAAPVRLEGNVITGGRAELESFGVVLLDERVVGDADSLIEGNRIFGGIGPETTAVATENSSPVILNNILLGNAGVTGTYGLSMVNGGSPLVAFNTIALLQVSLAVPPPTLAAGILDVFTSGNVVGNLIVTNQWARSTLFYFPYGTGTHSRYLSNALYHWEMLPSIDDQPHLLWVGEPEDGLAPESVEYPRAPDGGQELIDLNALDKIENTILCNPLWRPEPQPGEGVSYDVHLGLQSGCRDAGPTLSAFAAMAEARGRKISALDFRDFDGDARPQGDGNDPGADEWTPDR